MASSPTSSKRDKTFVVEEEEDDDANKLHLCGIDYNLDPADCLCAPANNILSAMTSSKNPFDDDYGPEEEENSNSKSTQPTTTAATSREDDDDEVPENLDEMLENMDLDKDYTMTFSFMKTDANTNSNGQGQGHSSPVAPPTTKVAAAAVPPPSSPKPALSKSPPRGRRKHHHNTAATTLEVLEWNNEERWNREELFSKHYKASTSEKEELQALATRYRVGSSSSWNLLPSLVDNVFGGSGGGSNASASAAAMLEKTSTILVYWAKHIQEQCKISGSAFQLVDGELAVLTHGLWICHAAKKNHSHATVTTAIGWDEIAMIQRQEQGGENPLRLPPGSYCIQIHLARPEKDQQNPLVICCRDPHIWTCISTLFLHAVSYSKTKVTERVGWQHSKVYAPWFTAAVLGSTKQLPSSRKNSKNDPLINTLDEYNEYAPLHYALLQHDELSTISVAIVDALVRAGADPNLPDGEGRTPMHYLASLSHSIPLSTWEQVKEILVQAGGMEQTDDHPNARGELFGSVDEANERTRERRQQEAKERERLAQEEQAKQAQQAMNHAMSALNERGQKIQQLGEKTTELHSQAATYGDLAARLKEEARKKKWYQL